MGAIGGGGFIGTSTETWQPFLTAATSRQQDAPSCSMVASKPMAMMATSAFFAAATAASNPDVFCELTCSRQGER